MATSEQGKESLYLGDGVSISKEVIRTKIEKLSAEFGPDHIKVKLMKNFLATQEADESHSLESKGV